MMRHKEKPADLEVRLFYKKAKRLVVEQIKLQNYAAVITEDDVTMITFTKDPTGWSALLSTVISFDRIYEITCDEVHQVALVETYKISHSIFVDTN